MKKSFGHRKRARGSDPDVINNHGTFAAMAAILGLLASCTSAAPAPAGTTATASASAQPAPSASQAPSATASPTATSSASAAPATLPPSEKIATNAGDLTIQPVYHGTVQFEFGGKVVVVDPWSKGAVDKLPKADLLLITDVHFDHFDKDAIGKVKKDSTVVIAPEAVAKDLPGAKVMKNGETITAAGFSLTAIPMYNKVRGPEAGKLYHDKGRGNGYVITFGDKKVYLSGDTECTDEMKALKNIDVAFVCMNLPYTMPPAEAAQCIAAFKPKVVYPYHYRDSNLGDLTKALEGEKAVEVRLRNWY